MNQFPLFASPWWVNFFIFIPVIAYLGWRKKLTLSRSVLIYTAFFGVAFGYIEATVVLYLRAMIKIENSMGNITVAMKLPTNILTAEIYREAATLIMIFLMALVASRQKYNRLAVFFWVFAFWDIFYYVWLKVLINWPQSLATRDLLFLIPAPWYSAVWWPISISLLLIFAVLAGKKRESKIVSR
jgi:hypothetical protein